MAKEDDAADRRERERRRWSRRASDAFGLGRDAPRLLVIEPHEDMRTLYRYVFEQTGYLVDTVADGLSAISMAEVRLPDVIVMEVVALQTDGFEILSRLSAQSTTSVPCIVVTATSQFRERAYAAGAAAVFLKPIGLDVILAEVESRIAATPRVHIVERQLRRSLLMLRELGQRLSLDVDVQKAIRTFIDRLQVAVLAVDDAGRYAAVSRGVEMLIGFSRDELLSLAAVGDTPAGDEDPGFRVRQEKSTDAEDLATITLRHRNGTAISVRTASVTVLPGLHAAAFAALDRQ